MFEVATVEFVLVWEKSRGSKTYKHKYEATLGQFKDRTEILRIGDTAPSTSLWLDKKSSEWFRIHSILAKEGYLRGR